MAFPDVNSSASIDSILPLCTLFEFIRTIPFSGDFVLVDTCNNDPEVISFPYYEYAFQYHFAFYLLYISK